MDPRRVNVGIVPALNSYTRNSLTNTVPLLYTAAAKRVPSHDNERGGIWVCQLAFPGKDPITTSSIALMSYSMMLPLVPKYMAFATASTVPSDDKVTAAPNKPCDGAGLETSLYTLHSPELTPRLYTCTRPTFDRPPLAPMAILSPSPEIDTAYPKYDASAVAGTMLLPTCAHVLVARTYLVNF
jgi:hypothetical protein